MPRRASARGRARPLNRILARGNRLNFNAANSQTHVPWIRGSSNDTRSHHSYDMHASGAVKGVNGIRPVSIAIARVPAAQLESDLICASRVHLTMPRCQLTIANAIHPSVPQSNRITLCTVTRHGRCLSLPLSLSLSLSLRACRYCPALGRLRMLCQKCQRILRKSCKLRIAGRYTLRVISN